MPLLFQPVQLNLLELKSFCIAVLAFIFTTWIVYLFNDIWDQKRDVQNISKQHKVLVQHPNLRVPALILLIVFGALLIFMTLSLEQGFTILIAGYFLINIVYTLWVKNILCLDVLCVASGFTIRYGYGALLFLVSFDVLLAGTITFLALFLVLCKRKKDKMN